MDPALWELLRGEEEAGEDRELEAIIRLAKPGIEIPDVWMVARFGTIATCRLLASDVVAVHDRDDVVSLKAARRLGEARELDPLGPPALHAAPRGRPIDLRRPPDLDVSGKGVVLGQVDWGVDVASPAFRRPRDADKDGDSMESGGTRFLALWDQRDLARGAPPQPYGYGAVHDRAAIDRALLGGRPYVDLGYHPALADRGTGSHGTHVLDIAAGNGRAGGPEGIAPDTDLVFVHLADRGTGGMRSLGDSVRLLEAAHFISATAGERPWVINLSLGRTGGSHDGRSLTELALDELLAAGPGRFVVQSAGNYFRNRTHAGGRLENGEVLTLMFESKPGDVTPNELEIWYDGADELAVRIDPPGAVSARPVLLGERAELVDGGRVLGRIYHRGCEPNTLANHIDAFLDPVPGGGLWTVTLEARRVVDGRFHAWIERDDSCSLCQARFRPADSWSASTTGTIANGHLPLVVGAYDGHHPARPPAPFSSVGPTRDGREKPDLSACGVGVLAARSTPLGGDPDAGLLVRKSGTSMATPHVTAAVALCLELGGRSLNAATIRRLVLDSCEPVPATDPPHRLGAGRLDIPRLLAATRLYLQSLPEEHAMNADTLSILQVPDTLYREFLYRPDGDMARSVRERFEVVGRPGDRVEGRRGDVLVEVRLGRPGGRTSVLHDPADLGRAVRPLPPGRLLLRPREAPDASVPTGLSIGDEPWSEEDNPPGEDPRLGRLIQQGMPENQITNTLFYARNPKLSGVTLQAGSAAARDWQRIRDAEVRPALLRRLTVQRSDPVELAVFLSQYENDDRVPEDYTKRFLSGPPLLSMGRTLRDRVLSNWRSGHAPLAVQGLYELALAMAGNPDAAALLCHNVTKAFVREGVAITWQGTGVEGEYTDGQQTIKAERIHPAGRLTYRSDVKKREVRSIFYLLFSSKAFGTDDPGDWYHFFVTATMTALAGAGTLGGAGRRGRGEDVGDAEDRGGGRAGGTVYRVLLAERVSDLEQQMTDPKLASVPGYRGWVLANVLSFLEGGHYGADYTTGQSDVVRESKVHVGGAVFGLRATGGNAGPGWRWYVPVAGSLSKSDLAIGFSLRTKTAEIWGPDARPTAEESPGVEDDAPDSARTLEGVRKAWRRIAGRDQVLSRVTIRDMANVPSAAVRNGGFDAWTNSAKAIYVDVSASRSGFIIEQVLTHEAVHVRQFADPARGAPRTYADMVRYELEAYRADVARLSAMRPGPDHEADRLEMLNGMRKTVADLETAQTFACGRPDSKGDEQCKRALISAGLLPAHHDLDELYAPRGPQRNPAGQESEQPVDGGDGDSFADDLLGKVLVLDGADGADDAEDDGSSSAEFSGPEHQSIGDLASGTEATAIRYGNPPRPLTFGDVITLAGDYYETYEQMRDLGGTAEGRAELEYARWSALDLDKKGVPRPGVDKDVVKRVSDRALLLDSRNLSHFSADQMAWRAYSLWHGKAIVDALEAGRTSNDAVWRRALTKEAFGDHFLTDSFSAGHVRTPRGDIRDWYVHRFPDSSDKFVAYMARFLFDRLDERQQLPPLLWWVGWVTRSMMRDRIRELGGPAVTALSLGDLVGLALHDRDNEGLDVVSDVDPDGHRVPGGYHWRAVGDGHLHRSKMGAATKQMAINAVIAGLRDLERVRGVGVRIGMSTVTSLDVQTQIREALGPDGFAARRLVPREDPTSTSNLRLPGPGVAKSPLEWRWGQLGPVAYSAVDTAVKKRIPPELREMAKGMDKWIDTPVGRVYGTPDAVRAFARHLADVGIAALEAAVDARAR